MADNNGELSLEKRVADLEAARRWSPPSRLAGLRNALTETAGALKLQLEKDQSPEDSDAASVRAERWHNAVQAWGGFALFSATRAFQVAAGGGLVAVLGVVVATAGLHVACESNELLEEQNLFFQTQIQQEAKLDYRSRRAALISTLYDRRKCWNSEESGSSVLQGCPTASLEARSAAVTTLVEIERGLRLDRRRWPRVSYGNTSILPELSLNGAVFVDFDFSRVSFRGGSFRSAKFSNDVDLTGTGFQGADLRCARVARSAGADFTGAQLPYSNVTGLGFTTFRFAKLMGAYLTSVWGDFREAKLQGATLSGDLRQSSFNGATLWGADLRDAQASAAAFNRASYCPEGTRNETLWPEGFKPKGAIVGTEADCDSEDVPRPARVGASSLGGDFASPVCSPEVWLKEFRDAVGCRSSGFAMFGDVVEHEGQIFGVVACITGDDSSRIRHPSTPGFGGTEHVPANVRVFRASPDSVIVTPLSKRYIDWQSNLGNRSAAITVRNGGAELAVFIQHKEPAGAADEMIAQEFRFDLNLVGVGNRTIADDSSGSGKDEGHRYCGYHPYYSEDGTLYYLCYQQNQMFAWSRKDQQPQVLEDGDNAVAEAKRLERVEGHSQGILTAERNAPRAVAEAIAVRLGLFASDVR